MRLRKERNAAGLTQAQLGKKARVTQGAISKLEKGRALKPTFETLDRLAKALQKSGRRVTAADLQPRRQPMLIKGARSLRKIRATA